MFILSFPKSVSSFNSLSSLLFSFVFSIYHFKLYCTEHRWHQPHHDDFIHCAVWHCRFPIKVQLLWASCEGIVRFGCESGSSNSRNVMVIVEECFAEEICTANVSVPTKRESALHELRAEHARLVFRTWLTVHMYAVTDTQIWESFF